MPKCNVCRTTSGQFGHQRSPLDAEQIGAGERAVAADYHEIRDAVYDQILGGSQASGPLSKVLATSRADNSAALQHHNTVQSVLIRSIDQKYDI